MISTKPPTFLCLVFSLLLAMALTACGAGSGSTPASATQRSVLHVATTSSASGEIMSFSIDPNTGALSNPSITAFSSWPSSIVALKADSSGKFVYASNFNTGNIHAFSVGPTSGRLTEVSGSPFTRAGGSGGNGGPIGVSPDGKYVAYIDAPFENIRLFAASNGTLTPTATVVQSNSFFPADFAFDPTGRFLYATNGDGAGDPQFAAFSVDTGTGTLTSITGSPFDFQTNTIPYAIVVHPNGRFVYSTLSNGFTQNGTVFSAIAGLKIDGTTGGLTQLPGSPFVYGTGMRTAKSMVIDPEGRFLYASTLGGLMGFSIDSVQGTLTVINQPPNAGIGVDANLAIDPAGKFLYVSQYSSISSVNGVLAFSINQTTGALTPIAGSPFQAGDYPGPMVSTALQ